MSVSQEDLVQSPATIDDFRPSHYKQETLDRLANPTEFVRYINMTNRLSDSDFETFVHDIGFRMALCYFRLAAWTGDVKLASTCEKYLDRIDRHRSRLAERPAVPQLGAATFTPGERNT